MKTVAFFNNKGGVGKTSLVYHLAWMFAEQGVGTLAVDFDPQSNLTSMFLDEERLETLWEDGSGETLVDSLQPLIDRTGDITPPHVELIHDGLGLIPGNLTLSGFEDLLSENWPKCLDRQEAAFRVVTAFHRVIMEAVKQYPVELVLIDVGPNLGAINRSALIAADHVILPLAPDLFSLQGMKNLGPTLREWRSGWERRRRELPTKATIDLPAGQMNPEGYVVMQYGVRDSRPVQAYLRWMRRIPCVYRDAVLSEMCQSAPTVAEDPYCLAQLKHYRSLMPLAMDARKPMFSLKPADGAIGAHMEAVKTCHEDFLSLAKQVADRTGIALE